MKILAIDITAGDNVNDPFGCAFYSDQANGYECDRGILQARLLSHARTGYTMVAHGAEDAITRLLYQASENVRVFYRQDEYSHAEWFYEDNKPSIQIWDVRLLAGGMTIRELCACTGSEQYEMPQRYSVAYKRRWQRGCALHGAPSCKECWGIIDRALWSCDTHGKPECEECYRLRQATAIYRYMERYAEFAESRLVKPSRTIGGMALKLWRVWDTPKPIRMPKPAMDTAARKAYYGGRVECLKLGATGIVSHGDVRAMYGAIMRDIELPTPESTVLVGKSDISSDILDRNGASECTVEIPDIYAPPLPYRWHGMVVYPSGRIRAWWPHVELRHAIECGVEILAVHKSLYGTEAYKPFSIFAGGLLDLRAQYEREHNAMQHPVKLMLNSLYGYIGMKSSWDSTYVMPLPRGTTASDWPFHEVQVCKGHMLLRRSDWRHGRSEWANPLWAAIITATGRVQLHTYMQANLGGLCYVDTDSVVTMGELDGTGKGEGQLEFKALYDRSWIVAPKIYRLESLVYDDKTSAAGIPRWQLDALLKGAQYKDGHVVGIMEAFWTGIEPGRYVRYHANRQYDTGKRVLLSRPSLSEDDGWSDTRPLRMSEMHGE
jgi:hypothetical protein